MDTIVYPRWMWMRNAFSRGKYLFKLLLAKLAIVYLLIVKGMAIGRELKEIEIADGRECEELDG